MATMLAGLEEVVKDEVMKKVEDAHIVETQRGKVFFQSNRSSSEIMTLRCVDNIYIFIEKFTMGPHKVHLNDLESIMRKMELGRKLGTELSLSRPFSFVVNASRSGKHTYSRYDLSEAASRGIASRYPKWSIGTADQHELEFRLDISRDQAIFSYRLTPPSFRFRGRQRMFSSAALRPTVAHALVWLSNPREDECFVDPFCGSGTIVAERSCYAYERLMGGDISVDAVQAARQNVSDSEGLIISEWDARELPLDAGSVDTVVSNLPFGEQILKPEDIAQLYLKFAGQLKRILAPQGRAVFLTDKVEALQLAFDHYGMHHRVFMELSLKGLHPRIIEVQT